MFFWHNYFPGPTTPSALLSLLTKFPMAEGLPGLARGSHPLGFVPAFLSATSQAGA